MVTSWALDSSQTKHIANELQTSKKVQTTDPAQAKKRGRTINCIRHNRRLQYRNTILLLFCNQDEIHSDLNRTSYGPSVGVIGTNISPSEQLSWSVDGVFILAWPPGSSHSNVLQNKMEHCSPSSPRSRNLQLSLRGKEVGSERIWRFLQPIVCLSRVVVQQAAFSGGRYPFFFPCALLLFRPPP